MASAGDKVGILPPFNKQHPGEYLVLGFNDGGGCTLLVDGLKIDFDAKFLAATGKTAPLPEPVIDPVAGITKATIKEAIWGGGDPVENIAALFGVKE